jgi:hypothetical protein
MAYPKEIEESEPARPVKYSVCSLVSNLEEYLEMVNSYQQAGFTDALCEFLYVDNTRGNKYDAYAGLNKLMARAGGQYLILSHQDVLIRFDTEADLSRRIADMDLLDPQWGVLANAGFADLKRQFKRISHLHETLNAGPFPHPVQSVDENFILLKKSAGLLFSPDLSGFHLYGTDICLAAAQKGYSCYVIDFHLLHKSTGNMNESFFKAREAFIQKHGASLSPRYIRTPCTIMFLSGSPLLNAVMNRPLMISIAKFLKKVELRIKGIKY